MKGMTLQQPIRILIDWGENQLRILKQMNVATFLNSRQFSLMLPLIEKINNEILLSNKINNQQFNR